MLYNYIYTLILYQYRFIDLQICSILMCNSVALWKSSMFICWSHSDDDDGDVHDYGKIMVARKDAKIDSAAHRQALLTELLIFESKVKNNTAGFDNF